MALQINYFHLVFSIKFYVVKYFFWYKKGQSSNKEDIVYLAV